MSGSIGANKNKSNTTTSESGSYNNTGTSTVNAPGYWNNAYQGMVNQYVPYGQSLPQNGGGQAPLADAATTQGAGTNPGMNPLQDQGSQYISDQLGNNPAQPGIDNAVGNLNQGAGTYRGLAGDLGDLNQDYYQGYADRDSYTIGQLEKKWGDMYGKVDPVTAQQVSATQGSEYMDSYLNPYTDQVVDAALADYDVGTDRSANSLRARRNAGSAFGDRAAIQDAVYQGEANRGRGSLSAGLRSDAFNTAAGFGMQDANRFLTADQTNAANSLAAAKFNNAQDLQRKMFDVNAAYQGDQQRLGAIDRMNSNVLDRARLEGMAGGAGIDAANLGVLGANMNTQDATTLFNMGNNQFGNQLDLLGLGTSLFGNTTTDQGTYQSTGTSRGSGSSKGGAVGS